MFPRYAFDFMVQNQQPPTWSGSEIVVDYSMDSAGL